MMFNGSDTCITYTSMRYMYQLSLKAVLCICLPSELQKCYYSDHIFTVTFQCPLRNSYLYKVKSGNFGHKVNSDSGLVRFMF